ncbi:Potassium-transporting ATPase KdpC subunit [Dirofilaria immitis]
MICGASLPGTSTVISKFRRKTLRNFTMTLIMHASNGTNFSGQKFQDDVYLHMAIFVTFWWKPKLPLNF